MGRSLTLPLGLGAALALALAPAAHQELAASGPEGPLANDTFLPLSSAAAVELAAGDAALAGARAGGPQAARELTRALEAWQAALALAREGELVPAARLAEGGAHEPRFAEDVVEGVERRLARLGLGERRAWAERFEPLAQAALERARGAQELAALGSRHPGTQAAARAALMLADQALEEGRPLAARGWLERAQRQVELQGLGASFDAPLAARRSALLSLAGPVRARPPAWSEARTLEPVRWLAFPDERFAPRRLLPRNASERFGRRLRPGGVRLSSGALAVQTVDRLFLVDDEGGLVALSLAGLLESLGWAYMTPFGDPEGDWPLTPAAASTAAGETLVMVLGRSTLAGGNALVCLEPPALGRAARVRWAISSSGELLSPEGPADTGTDARVLEEGHWAFQPGPLIAEDSVLVQARHWPGAGSGGRGEGRAQAHLFAFELGSGRLLWRRFLGLGADRAEESSGALPVRRGFDRSAQPLAALGQRVFAPTGLGVGALVDLVDGRVRWAFRTRRHGPDGRGPEASRPPLVVPGQEEGAEPLLVWAPGDSDQVYRLAARPAGGDPGALLLLPPAPIGSALELLAADQEHELVLARAGARQALTRRTPAEGRELELLLLGREERALGAVLASPLRLLLATERGLYLLDRERDLYLLDQEPSPEGAGAGGASLVAAGERVWLITGAGVWELAARR